jgi:hypothetical protein
MTKASHLARRFWLLLGVSVCARQPAAWQPAPREECEAKRRRHIDAPVWCDLGVVITTRT